MWFVSEKWERVSVKFFAISWYLLKESVRNARNYLQEIASHNVVTTQFKWGGENKKVKS